jgi:23S rRNA (guanosine2251-2'-O)-methyltransferase
MENKKYNNKGANQRPQKQGQRPAPRREDNRRAYADEEMSEGLIIGRNAVRELLKSGRTIDKLLVQKGEREGSIVVLVAEAIERHIPVVETDRAKLDKMTNYAVHQGVVAMAAEKEYCTVEDILAIAEERGEKPFIIILDGVEDPHNLGAIIRSAECSGAHGVIIPKRRAVGLTQTVGKASAGAIEHMRVAKVTNLATTIDELKERGLWFYAADMDGDSYYNTDFSGGVALVMGSEGYGISRLVKEKCDFVVSIPLYGNVNSLNVSCAGAVIMTEVARQRNRK